MCSAAAILVTELFQCSLLAVPKLSVQTKINKSAIQQPTKDKDALMRLEIDEQFVGLVAELADKADLERRRWREA